MIQYDVSSRCHDLHPNLIPDLQMLVWEGRQILELLGLDLLLQPNRKTVHHMVCHLHLCLLHLDCDMVTNTYDRNRRCIGLCSMARPLTSTICTVSFFLVFFYIRRNIRTLASLDLAVPDQSQRPVDDLRRSSSYTRILRQSSAVL